jgi:hypothetical protein
MRLLGWWWSVDGCGVVWCSVEQYKSSQPEGSDGDGGGEGRKGGGLLCRRRRRGDGELGTGMVSGRNWNGGLPWRPGLPFPCCPLARPCPCPSLSPKESRTTGRRVPFQRKRDPSVETERRRAFAPAGWDWDWESPACAAADS